MNATMPSTAHAPESILIFVRTESFAQSLKSMLERNGYRGAVVTTESAAFAEMNVSVPSLIIIDRQEGTISILRKLRILAMVPIVAIDDSVPTCSEDECVQDYDRGVDLVVCSRSVRELVARVRAILRRRDASNGTPVRYGAGDLRMDLDRHEVTVQGHLVDLTPKEFQILRQFLESPSRVFSRQEMLNRVWGEGYALEEHALDVHIHSLRHKIETDPTHPALIVTVRGVGYKLRT